MLIYKLSKSYTSKSLKNRLLKQFSSVHIRNMNEVVLGMHVKWTYWRHKIQIFLFAFIVYIIFTNILKCLTDHLSFYDHLVHCKIQFFFLLSLIFPFLSYARPPQLSINPTVYPFTYITLLYIYAYVYNI